MLFNSIPFLVFLPIVFVAVALAPLRWRKRILLVASYYFYGSWDWRFLTLIFATSAVDFAVARALMEQSDVARRKRLLMISVCFDLGVLGFFKYYNFFVDTALSTISALGLHASASTLSIILPVGISFYTFQSMSYVIDVYRRDLKPIDSFWDYALFVSYFPQLVAGPIERASRLIPQILTPARVDSSRIQTGITLIVLGLAKKVLIADTVAPMVDQIFAHPSEMSTGLLLQGAYLFSFQIYGDFSGYSDIARGVSELFGIRLMVNFNQPYLSQSITEFWRRWHISLSTWLRDYLYIPLGGNRYGSLMTYRNLMLTMLIGGLWHGASWTFVVWGGLHGLFLASERRLDFGTAVEDSFRQLSVASWLWRLLRIALTFHLVVLAWIFFRAPDFGVAYTYIAGILSWQGLGDLTWLPFVVGAAILLIDLPQNISGEHTAFLRVPWWLRSPLYCGVCLVVLVRMVYGGREMPFIYFQF